MLKQTGLWAAPWIPGIVWRRWREAVVSRPSFWSDIFFRWHEGLSVQDHQEKMETRLTSAGTSPLNISINARAPYDMDEDETNDARFQSILSHIHKSKSLKVIATDHSLNRCYVIRTHGPRGLHIPSSNIYTHSRFTQATFGLDGHLYRTPQCSPIS